VPNLFAGSWLASLSDTEGRSACATGELAAGDAVVVTKLAGVLHFASSQVY